MNPAQSRAIANRSLLFLFLIGTCFISINGCEDAGVVGQGFTDTDTSVEIDTFQVDAVEGESHTYYSGNLPYLRLFQRPVFRRYGGDRVITPDTAFRT